MFKRVPISANVLVPTIGGGCNGSAVVACDTRQDIHIWDQLVPMCWVERFLMLVVTSQSRFNDLCSAVDDGSGGGQLSLWTPHQAVDLQQ